MCKSDFILEKLYQIIIRVIKKAKILVIKINYVGT